MYVWIYVLYWCCIHLRWVVNLYIYVCMCVDVCIHTRMVMFMRFSLSFATGLVSLCYVGAGRGCAASHFCLCGHWCVKFLTSPLSLSLARSLRFLVFCFSFWRTWFILMLFLFSVSTITECVQDFSLCFTVVVLFLKIQQFRQTAIQCV